MGLTEQETEELKALQEERKSQHMSDSNRLRLSELLKKGEEEKAGGGKAAPAAAKAPAAGGK